MGKRERTMEQPRVYIVDDDLDFRESLTWMLEGAGYSVVAYESAEAFLAAYQCEPGCLLLDVRMDGMSGLALQQEMNQRGYLLPVIVITGHGDVAMAVQAMKNRALDFIEKPFDDQALLAMIDAAQQQARENFSQQDQQQQVREDWQSLSKRERQVAELVIKGLTNREIAEGLEISIKTVEIHRSRVMKKMRARNLAELLSMSPLH